MPVSIKFPFLLFGCIAVVGLPLDSHDACIAAEVVKFDRDIRPILAEHCTVCHGPDAAARTSELRLDDPASALAERDGRRAVVPGHPAQSELMRRITSSDPQVQMPPPDAPNRLTSRQVQLLRRWIEEGGTWSDHWSFVRPQRPPLPPLDDTAWPRESLDYFVLARLEQDGLQHSPPADRATLLRRVTFALTGLPPTVEELDAFLTDDSADAYDQVVSRLLDSVRYGEHMAFAWLDAARYADTSGYQADWERRMWPWRDWVVQALNGNMPFDQFTVEQLAGDLLPNASLSQKLATGFNRNHRINDEGGSLDAEFQVEYVVDRVDTTCTVWLALTGGCARCHDHKYDPVSQKDFYRLYAFFNNVPEKGIDGRKGFAAPHIEVPNPAVEAQLRTLQARRLALAASTAAEDPVSDPRTEQIKRLDARIEKLAQHAKTPVMVMRELSRPRNTYLLKRGAYDQPDTSERLFPALPEFIGRLPAGAPADRLTLARWLVGPDNPLTARVIANRLWQHHFGIGLVRTSEDFGTRGERPSHPQLLDWLATELVRTGWDVKRFHRMIVTSATFRQASRTTEELHQRDPDNRLLARGPRMRLSGPAIRDQALAVSGLLSPRMGGPAVKPYQPEGLWKELSFGTGKTTVDFYVQDHGESLYRRSLYTFWKRTVAPPRLAVFDGTGREMCRVRSERTNTPLQALTLQNDVTFVEAARHLARRMLEQGGQSATERIHFGWRTVTSRLPNKSEERLFERAISRYAARFRSDPEAAKALLAFGESPNPEHLDLIEHATYTLLAQCLLNLDETITFE